MTKLLDSASGPEEHEHCFSSGAGYLLYCSAGKSDDQEPFQHPCALEVIFPTFSEQNPAGCVCFLH